MPGGQLPLFGDGALAAAARESKLHSRRRLDGGADGLRAAVLGSGSGGNSTIVESVDGCLLLDAGFSCRELERRLDLVGRSATDVDAVLLTHEHEDHSRGACRFARRHQVPVYGTRGTYRGPQLRELGRFARPMGPAVPLTAAGFRIEVFPVPHDAREPVGIVVESGGGYRLGLATDLGRRTAEAWRSLRDLDVLLLESNHDLDMLRTGPYPWRLKERVASARGHLSNEEAAAGLDELLSDRLSWVVLCHLSETNNSPAFAAAAVQPVLDRRGSSAKLVVAEQHRPGPWLEVGQRSDQGN